MTKIGTSNVSFSLMHEREWKVSDNLLLLFFFRDNFHSQTAHAHRCSRFWWALKADYEKNVIIAELYCAVEWERTKSSFCLYHKSKRIVTALMLLKIDNFSENITWKSLISVFATTHDLIAKALTCDNGSFDRFMFRFSLATFYRKHENCLRNKPQKKLKIN